MIQNILIVHAFKTDTYKSFLHKLLSLEKKTGFQKCLH